MNTQPSILLLGIGNLLWADEGFGVRVIEQLQRHYRFPEQITVLDGGTQGIYLVEHVQAADVLIVFDAIDYGLAPGTLKQIANEHVPNFLGAKKMSLHQTGFQEVLAVAAMLGAYPKQLLLIGVQPEELEDYGGSLRPCVKAQIQPAIDLALAYLQTLGVHAETIDTPLVLADPMLDIQRYEQERPAEDVACRVGDERVLCSEAFVLQQPKSGSGIAIAVDYRGQY